MTVWMAAALTICGITTLLALVTLVVWIRQRPWLSRRERLALREDANGRALLWLARDIEAHARRLQQLGQSDEEHRQWAALCRRVAIEHLACINALLIESGPGASLVRDGLAPSRGEAARSNHAPK